MIPLKDHEGTSIFPFITYGLLIANIAVFFRMLTLDEMQLNAFIQNYAVIPQLLIQGINPQSAVTSMFLHGGFGHIIGNMLFLHIFGDNLEERFGHFRYLLFYLLCGLAAVAGQVVINPISDIPMLGASGAISGLLGAYLLLFPNHRVDILVPVFGFLNTATVPAYTMLLYWIVTQFMLGVGTLGATGGGVAYFAHIGGFIAGIILSLFFNRRSRTIDA